MNKPIVAVTRRLPAPTEAMMTELFEVRLNPKDVALTAEQIIDRTRSHCLKKVFI